MVPPNFPSAEQSTLDELNGMIQPFNDGTLALSALGLERLEWNAAADMENEVKLLAAVDRAKKGHRIARPKCRESGNMPRLGSSGSYRSLQIRTLRFRYDILGYHIFRNSFFASPPRFERRSCQVEHLLLVVGELINPSPYSLPVVYPLFNTKLSAKGPKMQKAKM